MSLDWNLINASNRQELLSAQEKPITEALVFECVHVGMRDITEKNWRTFYTRSLLYRRFIHADILLPSDIRKRIGLQTNVTNESKSKWLERVWKEAESRAKNLIAMEDRATAEQNGTVEKPVPSSDIIHTFEPEYNSKTVRRRAKDNG